MTGLCKSALAGGGGRREACPGPGPFTALPGQYCCALVTRGHCPDQSYSGWVAVSELSGQTKLLKGEVLNKVVPGGRSFSFLW